MRLRLPHAADAGQVARLTGRDEDAADRLVRFDPRERAVACATTLGEAGEVVVGVGAIDLRDGARPDVLLVDSGYGEELRALVGGVLRERAAVAHDRRAAAHQPRWSARRVLRPLRRR